MLIDNGVWPRDVNLSLKALVLCNWIYLDVHTSFEFHADNNHDMQIIWWLNWIYKVNEKTLKNAQMNGPRWVSRFSITVSIGSSCKAIIWLQKTLVQCKSNIDNFYDTHVVLLGHFWNLYAFCALFRIYLFGFHDFAFGTKRRFETWLRLHLLIGYLILNLWKVWICELLNM